MTKLINITVDDSAPDPYSGQTILYTPVGHWSRGQDCVGCLAQPDANMTYGRTWHDTTYDPGVAKRNQIESAVFSFVGSAVYIYGILGRGQSDFNSTTDLSLFIDNQPYANFSYAPPGLSDFGYNTTLFAVSSIPHGPHTLVLQNGFPNGRVSLLLLDYLVYTTEINETVSASNSSTGSPTASSTSEHLQPTSLRPSSSPGLHCSLSNKAETIVLALLGGVLLVLLAVLYILELRRRHSQHDDELNGTAEAGSPLGSPRSCILEPSISANSSYTIRASPSTASSYTLQTLPSYGSSLTLRNPPSSVRDSRGPSSHNAADVSNICVAELSLHSDIESTNPQEDARVARQLEKLRILSDRNARRRSHLF